MHGRCFFGIVGWADMLTNYVVSTRTTNMSEEQYIQEQQTVHHMLYHNIFCPKRRRKVLVGPVRNRFEQIVRGVVQEHGWQIVELAIQPDRVHLVMQANPYTLPTDIACLLKGHSAHQMRQEFPQLRCMPSLWTRSTFYATAGLVSQHTISAYTERQSKT
jgi:REP-associated tyrosine transposase